VSAPAAATPEKDKGDKSSSADKSDDIVLFVGETRVLQTPGLERFSVGGKEFIEGDPDDRNSSNFIVKAKKPGLATLLFFLKDGTERKVSVTVTAKPMAAVEREVQALVESVSGVHARRVGGRIFLEGGVTSESDVRRCSQIAALFPDQVVSMCVQGSAGGAERKQLIRIDFYFVQYERTSSYAVGIGFPAAIGGNTVLQSTIGLDLIGKTITSAQAQIINQPLPRIDIAARNGWAKVMKQSSVLTGNGSEAKFSSGGEQNFAQTQGIAVGLVQVKYGTDIAVLPRYDAGQKEVELKLTADVSDLVNSQGGNVPGRTTTRLDTMVTLKLGQALVLSGIKTQSRRQDIEGLPLLSEIPVIGPLFGSHRKSEEEVEGAVFVVPSVVDSMPKSSLEMIKGAMATFREYSGDIKTVGAFSAQPPSAK
jgi:pilus assembly protein CpaC